jgi:hypothetical protein
LKFSGYKSLQQLEIKWFRGTSTIRASPRAKMMRRKKDDRQRREGGYKGI